MRTVTCICGTRFEAKSQRATYCSGTCRKRGSRAGVKQQPRAEPTAPVAIPPVADVDVRSVTGAAVAELAEAGALDSAAGLAAVRLAQLIDMATPMAGSSVAAWTRELRAALADAKKDTAAVESDPLDELERKRAARGA